ncbi:MAG: exodeoxyribonuclease VII small subunit, partial [Acidimicrobiaceae bacterium]|nr:exodeoxyribonuclease VII small subunit [Acidimicrobiaceae bacterium]
DDGIDIDVLSELVERAAHLITVCRGRISAAQQRVAGIVQTLETEISP